MDGDDDQYDDQYEEDQYEDNAGYDGAEIVEENEDEYDGDDEGEFKAEFGAFDRSGHLRVFAETEEDQFFNNMELYAYRTGIPSNMEDIRKQFSVLVRNYPHPRCLNPGACFSMSAFRDRASGRYNWTSGEYREDEFRGITPFTLLRYIALFNKYA